MKKFLCLLLAGIMVLSLAACGSASSGGQESSGAAQSNETKNSETPSSPSQEKLSEPALAEWQIANINGFNTLFTSFTNNNNVAIDASYNVVFYKEGKELQKGQDCMFICLAPGKTHIGFDNWGIPADADEIKVEFTSVTESSYKPVDVKVTEKEKTDEGINIELTIEDDIYQADIFAKFLHNGVIVGYDTVSVYTKGTSEELLECYEPYDSYEISAYGMQEK